MSNNQQKTKLTAPKSALKAAAPRAPAQRSSASKSQPKPVGKAMVAGSKLPRIVRVTDFDVSGQDQSRNGGFDWNRYAPQMPNAPLAPPSASTPVEKKVKAAERSVLNVARVKLEPAKKKKSSGVLSFLKDKISDPAVLNAALAAVQSRFPSKTGALVPPLDPHDNDRAYRTPRASQTKISVPTIVSTETTPMYYGMVLINSFWSKKALTLATLGAGTNGLATVATTDDPLYSACGSKAAQVQNGGMCVHFLNNTALQTMGGEVIFGQIRGDQIVAGLSWDTLLALQNTQYASMASNPDLCYPWAPASGDAGQFAYNASPITITTGVPSAGLQTMSWLFVATRSATAQSIEVCIDSVFGVEPTQANVVLLGGKIWPGDPSVYNKALEVMTPPDGVYQPNTPQEEESSFMGVLKSLGKGVADTILPGLGSVVEKGISWIGGLFGDRRIDELLCSLELIPQESVSKAMMEGSLPSDLGELLLKLTAYKVRVRDAGVRVYRPDNTVYEYRPSSASRDEFGDPVSLPAQILDSADEAIQISPDVISNAGKLLNALKK